MYTINYEGESPQIMDAVLSHLAGDNYDGPWFVQVLVPAEAHHSFSIQLAGYILDKNETHVRIQPVDDEDFSLDVGDPIDVSIEEIIALNIP
jgi:hypothetical protein